MLQGRQRVGGEFPGQRQKIAPFCLDLADLGGMVAPLNALPCRENRRTIDQRQCLDAVGFDLVPACREASAQRAEFLGAHAKEPLGELRTGAGADKLAQRCLGSEGNAGADQRRGVNLDFDLASGQQFAQGSQQIAKRQIPKRGQGGVVATANAGMERLRQQGGSGVRIGTAGQHVTPPRSRQ